jgi:DNA (cytosine-5)-methyltransferase 1
MRHGSLFSGIGGFDYAAQMMGWENVFHCEWNEFGQRVLKHYWPQAISYHDITKTDFTIHRGGIDICSGGFPCQPYSTAGKRLGKDDERHLWPEMLRAIREIQPRWVVGENVFGLVNWNGGMVFEEVQADLESEGYEVQPFILPAAGVNAPHRRDRVWFVAHSISSRTGNIDRKIGDERWGASGCREESLRQDDWEIGSGGLDSATENGYATYSQHNGHITTKGGRSDGETGTRSEEGEDGSEQFEGICQPKELGGLRDATNANGNERCKGRMHQAGQKKTERHVGTRNALGNERTTWENFPTQPPLCSGDDGLPSELDGITFSKWRNESIKAAGNAIVPQVALQIFKAIEQYEELRLRQAQG